MIDLPAASNHLVIEIRGGLISWVSGKPDGLVVEVRDYDVPEEDDGEDWPRDDDGEPYASNIW